MNLVEMFLWWLIRSTCRHPKSALYGNKEGLHCAKCGRLLFTMPMNYREED